MKEMSILEEPWWGTVSKSPNKSKWERWILRCVSRSENETRKFGGAGNKQTSFGAAELSTRSSHSAEGRGFLGRNKTVSPGKTSL